MFVALEPSGADRATLTTWRDRLVSGRDDLRPVAPQALHLTLVFLGWQREADADAIARATFDVLPGDSPPLLRPIAVKAVPPRGARLFALDLEDEGDRCRRLQGAVSAALEELGVYQPEKRPFWPHVTFARVKRDRRAAALEVAPPVGAFEATEVTLYRSILRPQGAEYEALERVRLGGAAC